MEAKPTHRWHWLVLCLIITAGVVARAQEITYNFDGDEVFSVRLAGKSFPEVMQGSLQDSPHPPLHNLTLSVWVKVFGPSEISARAFSITLSVVFLTVAFLLMRRLIEPWLALGVVAILAVSPLFVYYGQQARPYALIACLGSLNLLAFVRLLEAPRDRRRILLWVLSIVALLHTQYAAVVLLSFEGLVALIYLRSEGWKICAYGFAGALLILPYVATAMGSAVVGGSDPLGEIAWMRPPTPRQFVAFYVSIFGVNPYVEARWLLLVVALLFGAYAVRHLRHGMPPAKEGLLFAVGLGVPTTIWLVSVFGPKAVFEERQMLTAALAFVAALGVCMARLPRAVAAVMVAVLVAWGVSTLPLAFPHELKPPWREIATELDAKYGARPVHTQEDWAAQPLDYYRHAGPVVPWSQRSEQGNDGGVLVLCRPAYEGCRDVDAAAPESARVLLGTWWWGRQRAEQHQLRLYEVRQGRAGGATPGERSPVSTNGR